MTSTRASISKASKRPKINIIPPKQFAPNAPSKTPSTKDISSSSIDYIPISPTSSTSLSPNGYLNPPTSSPPRVSPPPPTQENASMDITLTLSPITLLDVQFDTPSPSPPIFGHPIPWNLFEAHGDSLLMPRVVKSRDEIFSRWGYCDNRGLSRLHNQSIERDRLIGIGFVLDFVEFISFTFGDKEMILVIEASKESKSPREDDRGVSEGRKDVREVFQQRGSGAKRKLSRCGRNQMGNEPILAFPEGADDFVVYYDARSKDLEAYFGKGRSDTLLTKRWLSMKKDIASCSSKYLAYSEVEVEYQGSSGLLLQPELPE
ncbi:hypothetical protein Tco_0435549 [Tanacetum coccineum]